jgi:nucleotide-binding universal stress UspA family protein
MGYANIMVSLDLGPDSADRVQLAAGLAKLFEATLTGVAARPIPVPTALTNLQEDGIIRAAEERRFSEELARTRDLFNRNAGEQVQTAWRSAEAGALAYLIQQARAADLIVVGRHGTADGDPGEMDVMPGPLLMEAGRPVLVVPPGIEHLSADRIVVAWKDTPEARRAVSAALPFLRQADHVHVVTVGPEARLQGAEDVAAHLMRHDVNASTRLLFGGPPDEADEVLRFARREYADLLVMGAYGHSRLREWAFGGMTRDILQTANVCGLMSH